MQGLKTLDGVAAGHCLGEKSRVEKGCKHSIIAFV